MSKRGQPKARAASHVAPRLLGVTPENAVRRPEVGVKWLRGLAAGCASSSLAASHVVIQLRDKEATDQQVRAAVRAFKTVPKVEHFRWVINQRSHLVKELALDGVHWPGSFAGAELSHDANFHGLSCHSLADLEKAAQSQASYAVFGPIFDTPSKRVYGKPQGLTRLIEACSLGQRLGLPVLSIGGMDARTTGLALQSGVTGVAAVRALGTCEEARRVCQLLADGFPNNPRSTASIRAS